MRVSQQKVVSSVCRYIHASTITPGIRPRPLAVHRQFHRTTSAQLPRKRSFFTSNLLLQQETSYGSPESRQPAPDAAAEEKQQPDRAPSKPSPKRTRAAAGPKSLRRVASIAQKPGARGPAAAVAESPAEPSDNSTTISALCVAEAFNMAAVADILQMHGFALDPDSTGFEAHDMVHARGVNGGDIFVFPTGTAVGWALPPGVLTTLATRQLLGAAEEPHVGRMEEEDLEFELDAHSERSYIRGDRVVLGTRHEEASGSRLETTLAKVAFSAGLARSTKLAVLESSLTAYFESTRKIPVQLSQGKPLNLSRRFVLQKTGELVRLRAQLNHQGELTDTLPDMLWDSSSELGLDTYYSRICKALDVDLRIEILNDKVTYANEIAGVLREISSEKHSSRLEWIIIALIAVEVLIEFRRMYMEHTPEQQKPAGGGL